MASGGSAIRGSRVGAGPMGEQDRGFHAERISISYWDALGNETVRHFAANLPEEEIPVTIDSPQSGLPAGRDKANPPSVAKLEPYKTHLAYVKERRSEEEASQLLEEALEQLRARRGTVKPTTKPRTASERRTPPSRGRGRSASPGARWVRPPTAARPRPCRVSAGTTTGGPRRTRPSCRSPVRAGSRVSTTTAGGSPGRRRQPRGR